MFTSSKMAAPNEMRMRRLMRQPRSIGAGTLTKLSSEKVRP
jgi:hypothetical protein